MSALAGGSERPLLIVVSSLSRSREYFFRSVSPQYRLWLFQGGAGGSRRSGWELPYLVGHTVLDTLDADAMTAAARAVSFGEEVTGILSYDEARIAATAIVADRLGLPTSPPRGGADGVGTSGPTRQALAAAGIAQPASVLATDRAGPPRRGPDRLPGGRQAPRPRRQHRRGPGRRRGPARRRVPVAADASLAGDEPYKGGALVEEYLDGPEISVDGAVSKGESSRLFWPARRPASTRTSRSSATSWTAPTRCCTTPRCCRCSPTPTASSGRGRADPRRAQADPARTGGRGGQRPARRRPHPVPRPARDRRRRQPGRGRGRLRRRARPPPTRRGSGRRESGSTTRTRTPRSAPWRSTTGPAAVAGGTRRCCSPVRASECCCRRAARHGSLGWRT